MHDTIFVSILMLCGLNMQGIEFLSYANTSPPYPEDWTSTYSLLLQGLKSAASGRSQQPKLSLGPAGDPTMAPASDSTIVAEGTSHNAAYVREAARWALQQVDMPWYAKTLARFHINAFRYGSCPCPAFICIQHVRKYFCNLPVQVQLFRHIL